MRLRDFERRHRQGRRARPSAGSGGGPMIGRSAKARRTHDGSVSFRWKGHDFAGIVEAVGEGDTASRSERRAWCDEHEGVGRVRRDGRCGREADPGQAGRALLGGGRGPADRRRDRAAGAHRQGNSKPVRASLSTAAWRGRPTATQIALMHGAPSEAAGAPPQGGSESPRHHLVDFNFDPTRLKGRFDLVFDAGTSVQGRAHATQARRPHRRHQHDSGKMPRVVFSRSFQPVIAKYTPQALNAVSQPPRRASWTSGRARRPADPAIDALTELERKRTPQRAAPASHRLGGISSLCAPPGSAQRPGCSRPSLFLQRGGPTAASRAALKRRRHRQHRAGMQKAPSAGDRDWDTDVREAVLLGAPGPRWVG